MHFSYKMICHLAESQISKSILHFYVLSLVVLPWLSVSLSRSYYGDLGEYAIWYSGYQLKQNKTAAFLGPQEKKSGYLREESFLFWDKSFPPVCKEWKTSAGGLALPQLPQEPQESTFSLMPAFAMSTEPWCVLYTGQNS